MLLMMYFLSLIFDVQVLSDPRRRGIYDQYGEDGLYGDVPPEDDNFHEDDMNENENDYGRLHSSNILFLSFCVI